MYMIKVKKKKFKVGDTVIIHSERSLDHLSRLYRGWNPEPAKRLHANKTAVVKELYAILQANDGYYQTYILDVDDEDYFWWEYELKHSVTLKLKLLGK